MFGEYICNLHVKPYAAFRLLSLEALKYHRMLWESKTIYINYLIHLGRFFPIYKNALICHLAIMFNR